MAAVTERDNSIAYKQDKSDRGALEKATERPIMKRFAAHVAEVFGLHPEAVTYERFADDIIRAVVDTYAPGESWRRGAPDWKLDILTHRGVEHLYVELKVKKQVFLMSEFGGHMKSGRPVANYGCRSFYLDRYVKDQIADFCEVSGLPRSRFAILFAHVSETPSGRYRLVDLRLTGLGDTENLLEVGYRGHEITSYSDGYGHESYLIPETATWNLDQLLRPSDGRPFLRRLMTTWEPDFDREIELDVDIAAATV